MSGSDEIVGYSLNLLKLIASEGGFGGMRIVRNPYLSRLRDLGVITLERRGLDEFATVTSEGLEVINPGKGL